MFKPIWVLLVLGSWSLAVTIPSGTTLTITSDSQLGTGSVVMSGGTLALASGSAVTVNHPIFLSSGTNTMIGAGTFSGDISGGGTLVFGGVTDARIVTSVNDNTGAIYITGGGTSGLTLYGSFANSSKIDLSASMALVSAGDSLNQLSDSGTLTMHYGATLDLSIKSGQQAETLGNLVVGDGVQRVNVNRTSSNPTAYTLAVGQLLRPTRGFLEMSASFNGSTQTTITNRNDVLFGGGGAAGTSSVSIIPFAINANSRYSATNDLLLTADSTGMIRTLNPGEYLTTFTGATATDNVQLGTTVFQSAPVSVNALQTQYAVNGAGTVTVASGLITGGGIVYTPVNFGSREGIVAEVSAAGPISGSNGVTFVNAGTVNSANTYTGQSTVAGSFPTLAADVYPNQPSYFGSDASAIHLVARGPDSYFGCQTPVTVARDLNIDSGTTRYGEVLDGPLTVTGNMTIAGNVYLDAYGNNYPFGAVTQTYSGNISGSGSLDTGYGTIIFSGNNTYTGGLTISTTVVAASDTAFGSGSVTTSYDQTLLARGNRSLNNALTLFPGYTFTTGGDNLSFAGTLNLSNGTEPIVVNNPVTAFSGWVTNGSINKLGAGQLRLGRVALSALNIGAGSVQFLPNVFVDRLNAPSFSSGTTLDITSARVSIYGTLGDTSVYQALLNEIKAQQITSSLAIAGRSGIGISNVTISQYFGSDYVSAPAVYLKLTLLGDANLDGKVDIADLGVLAGKYGQSGVWTDGDFNYDRTIDIADLGLLATNYGVGSTSPLPLSFQQALALVESQTGVQLPEPAVAATSIAMLLTLRRRAKIIADGPLPVC